MKEMNINGKWRLGWQPAKKNADYKQRPTQDLIDIDVPGDIHLALMDAGIIEDPVISDNVKSLRWISDQEWWFEKEFSYEEIDGKAVELHFLGLDYQADIWLNGKYLGSHKNMFRPFIAKVGGILRKNNRLLVRLLPFLDDISGLPDPDMMHNPKREHCTMPTEINRYRPWMRKAQYVFGWNWTQDLSTCGIWQDVFLRKLDSTAILNETVFTKVISDNGAGLEFCCTVQSPFKKTTCASLEIEVISPDGNSVACFSKDVVFAPGKTDLCLEAVLENPELWWPAGFGKQNLYKAKYRLTDKKEKLSCSELRFGIRTVEIAEPPRSDGDGWKFRFLINGEYIFIKGANWVPADACPARVTAEKRKFLLHKAVEANFNYLRVWGGGIYEPDDFYDLCDELGIMIWQDFMFSCAEYPDFDKEFVREVELEAGYQITRLRRHPSIICWCGNNELEQQCGSAAFRAKRPDNRYYGENLFKDLIPSILSDLDPWRPYKNSSGINGEHDPDLIAMKYESGIVHIDVFDEILRQGKKQIPSFLGEWYTASAPTMKTIEKFLPERDRNWNSPIWQMHDFVSKEFNMRVDQYVASLEGLDFEKSLYYFHCLQMEMHKAGMELCRKHKENCGGNVIWMYADAYTGLTRTIIDYYLHLKPAYYVLKRACAPLLPIAEDMGDVIEIAVVNDLNQAFDGELEIELVSFQGEIRFCEMKQVKISANGIGLIHTMEATAIQERDSEFLLMRLVHNGEVISENRFFFECLRKLKIPLAELEVNTGTGELADKIELSSRCYARNVHIGFESDAELDDNYFDLSPGNKKTIHLTKPVKRDSISIDWENRQVNLEQLLKSKVSQMYMYADCLNNIDLQIFNPDTKQELELKLSVFDKNDIVAGQNHLLSLKPGETRNVKVKLKAPPLSVDKTYFDINIAIEHEEQNALFTLPMKLISPLQTELELSSSGSSIIYKNLSDYEISADIYQSVENSAGKLLETRQKLTLPGKGKDYVSIDNNSDLKACSGCTILDGSWGNIISGFQLSGVSRFLKNNEFEVITDKIVLEATETKSRRPSLAESSFYRIPKGRKYFGGFDGNVTLGFNYNSEELWVDCFIAGETFLPVSMNNPHCGASMEIGLSNSDNLAFEACVSLTESGGATSLRRLGGNVNLNQFEHLTHYVYCDQKNKLLYIRFAVKWAWIDSAYKPCSGDNLKCTFIFNSAPGKGVSLFDGIAVKKDINGYGNLKLD